MREILFRGKRTDNGEWVEGYFATHTICTVYDTYLAPVIEKIPQSIYGDDTTWEIIPETRGEFTGLTDKNGRRIFEGDIVRHDVNYHDMVISYDVENWDGWLYEDIDDNMQAYSICEFCLNDIEVIGNIHDNPELLEGGGDNA